MHRAGGKKLIENKIVEKHLPKNNVYKGDCIYFVKMKPMKTNSTSGMFSLNNEFIYKYCSSSAGGAGSGCFAVQP